MFQSENKRGNASHESGGGAHDALHDRDCLANAVGHGKNFPAVVTAPMALLKIGFALLSQALLVKAVPAIFLCTRKYGSHSHSVY